MISEDFQQARELRYLSCCKLCSYATYLMLQVEFESFRRRRLAAIADHHARSSPLVLPAKTANVSSSISELVVTRECFDVDGCRVHEISSAARCAARTAGTGMAPLSRFEFLRRRNIRSSDIEAEPSSEVARKRKSVR